MFVLTLDEISWLTCLTLTLYLTCLSHVWYSSVIFYSVWPSVCQFLYCLTIQPCYPSTPLYDHPSTPLPYCPIFFYVIFYPSIWPATPLTLHMCLISPPLVVWLSVCLFTPQSNSLSALTRFDLQTHLLPHDTLSNPLPIYPLSDILSAPYPYLTLSASLCLRLSICPFTPLSVWHNVPASICPCTSL